MSSVLRGEITHPRISAVILAAGTSRRMGQPKQLLPMGESTMLAQTIENLFAAELEEIVLVLGSFAETIQRNLSSQLLQRLKIVLNHSYEQGIAGSLRVGLSSVDPRSSAALIVLGDQPFVHPRTLDLIVHEYRRSRAKIAVPVYREQRGNPVLLDRSVFAEAMALEGDVGCRAIFPQHLKEIMNVKVEDSGVLLDVDDPADYQRLNTKK
ncbi:MAG: nucleotidyltransferase family protein [Acidobacteriaceae bacterium]